MKQNEVNTGLSVIRLCDEMTKRYRLYVKQTETHLELRSKIKSFLKYSPQYAETCIKWRVHLRGLVPGNSALTFRPYGEVVTTITPTDRFHLEVEIYGEINISKASLNGCMLPIVSVRCLLSSNLFLRAQIEGITYNES